MNGRAMSRQTSAKQTNAQPQLSQATEQTDDRKCRQTLAAQIAKSSLGSNGINAKDNVD